MHDFYKTPRWQQKREHILRRDGYLDMVRLRATGERIEADTVHHILPRERWPRYAWEDWTLISVSQETHKRYLHEKMTGKLTKMGWRLARETAALHGVKMKTKTMVIGLPGTGKSTYVKKHLDGGLAYELDSIACAFRLTVPHKEEPHSGARRMAAALRRAWIDAALEYTDHIWIVRIAPGIEELAETMPDEIIVCERQYVQRGYDMDVEKEKKKISAAVKWAEEMKITVKYSPPRV